ncbi:hypothetical protein CBR_g651 [Chara braunii]|uniref:Uncharacterized protein n=1 Tax=Chara braunii TaxID=69332 RepID=A0A388KBW7_CHABU|nr:hypothetical protein CBR_g651 [Chara braunii]|eukprot:GBG67521.1 hypothetical protein CBR_g651 [Chara braunii]
MWLVPDLCVQFQTSVPGLSSRLLGPVPDVSSGALWESTIVDALEQCNSRLLVWGQFLDLICMSSVRRGHAS